MQVGAMGSHRAGESIMGSQRAGRYMKGPPVCR